MARFSRVDFGDFQDYRSAMERIMTEILWRHRELYPASGSIQDMGPLVEAVTDALEAHFMIEPRPSARLHGTPYFK